MEPRSWNSFRQLMPITERWAYFDHAAVAPLPQPAVTAISNWAEQAAREGDTIWLQWRARLEEIRSHAARLLGASSQEIAFIPNTTAGVDLVAQSIPWSSGDNLVTLANEFPSNRYPWLNLQSLGVSVREVEAPQGRVDLQRIADACDEGTRLIAVSWIGYASGWRLELDELACLARERRVMIFLDAIQGLGVFPLDLRKTSIDFVAADGHKWMLGPEGAGVIYIRQCHLATLRPRGLGWNSVSDPFAFEDHSANWRPDAARYEGGSHNLAGLMALGASLELLSCFGLSASASPLADRVLALSDYAVERLLDRGAKLLYERSPEHRSGIVTFAWQDHPPQDIRRRCRDAGIVVSVRGGGVRISPHAYNLPEEIDRFIEALP